MAATHVIAARVEEETKLRFRTLANRHDVTESVLLKRLVDDALQSTKGPHDARVEATPPRRMSRSSVRLADGDFRLLAERARSRQMRPATYVSVLIRSHLRHMAPLPKPELTTLKSAVAELTAFGRNLNQLTKLAHNSRGTESLSGDHVRQMLRVCEAVRGDIKRLIIANASCWESDNDKS
jgi:hypothetical protein